MTASTTVADAADQCEEQTKSGNARPSREER